MIDAGLGVIVNVCPTSNKMADEVDPTKLASPLYWAVMLYWPPESVVLNPAPGGWTPESITIGGAIGVPFE